MRQQQQKNRSRGRNRKQPNPMSRNYESNGPDVKIRGNAAHIAEKYAALARDAAAAGDRVMAENYLQHAEHYNRVIAAAMAASQARMDEQSSHGRGPQPDASYDRDDDDDLDGDDDNGVEERHERRAERRHERGSERGSERQAEQQSEQPVPAAGAQGEAEAEEAPRRPRQRGRRANGNGRGAHDEGGRGGSDGAKLPGSLLGMASEAAAAESGAED